MAEVEEDRRFWDVDLSVAARVTGIAAIVVAVAELMILVANFSMTEAVFAVIGSDGVFWIFRILGIIRIAATAVVAGGLIVGWRQERLIWTQGIGETALGLVVLWGWWAVDRFTDIWQWGRFTGVDPSDPIYVQTIRTSQWVGLALTVLPIVLLLTGGVRLLVRRS